MVGRFIQQQRIWGSCNERRQPCTGPLPARKARKFPVRFRMNPGPAKMGAYHAMSHAGRKDLMKSLYPRWLDLAKEPDPARSLDMAAGTVDLASQKAQYRGLAYAVRSDKRGHAGAETRCKWRKEGRSVRTGDAYP